MTILVIHCRTTVHLYTGRITWVKWNQHLPKWTWCSLDMSYILNNFNNSIIYDFTPAYHKPHLHKSMFPNVTGNTVITERSGSVSEIHAHCRTLWSVVNFWIRYNDLCCKLCNISVLVNQCFRPLCTLGGSTYPQKKKTNKPRALTI